MTKAPTIAMAMPSSWRLDGTSRSAIAEIAATTAGNCREVNGGIPRPKMERERYPSGERQYSLTPGDPLPIAPFAGRDEKPGDDHQGKSETPDGDYDRIRAR